MTSPAPPPLVLRSPQRYVQGPGVTERLADEMRAAGLAGPVLVSAGDSAIGLLAPAWAEAFSAAGWPHRVLAFGGRSDRRDRADIAAEATAMRARAIVGAGGGRLLDAARAAAASSGLPFVSCPTGCPTAAATTAVSMIHADEGPFPGAVIGCEVLRRSPDLVLVDTRLVAEGPPRLLAAGIGAAVGTFYGARSVAASGAATPRHGRTALTAVELARLCLDVVFEHGVAAVAACRRRVADDSLERVVEAATLASGVASGSTDPAAAHAIHHALEWVAAARSTLHGERVAFGTLAQLALEAAAAETPAARAEAASVASFLVDVGLPVTLAALGIDAADDEAVRAVAARAAAVAGTAHRMPFPIDAPAVVRAIRDADALGRAALAGRPIHVAG